MYIIFSGSFIFPLFGSGVKYSAFILDFSYLINATTDAGVANPLANTMRFSMTWNFGRMDEINIINDN